MADKPSPPDGQPGVIPPALFGMVATVFFGVVVAILYFAREVIIPIVLAVLLSFLLGPAVRWLQRRADKIGTAEE